MFHRRFARIASCFIAVSTHAFAQSAHTPAAGSEERKGIMDAIRQPAEKDLQLKVVFKVDRLRVARDWAYARVSPIRPDGGKIDFSKTKYKEDLDLGMFDPQGEALLFMKSSGEWTVLEWVFGSTDVPSVAWPDKHAGLPKALLQ